MKKHNSMPIGSMYGIFTYIWLIFKVHVGKYTVHVGKYTIHGSYGHGDVFFLRESCDTCQQRTSKVAI